jgi:hypothetical protein
MCTEDEIFNTSKILVETQNRLKSKANILELLFANTSV